MWYSLFVRHLAAEIVENTFFQYICQHNLLHQSQCHLPQTTHTPIIGVIYSTKQKTILFLLIPLIPVQQQQQQQHKNNNINNKLKQLSLQQSPMRLPLGQVVTNS